MTRRALSYRSKPDHRRHFQQWFLSLCAMLMLGCNAATEYPSQVLLRGDDSAGAEVEILAASDGALSARVTDGILGSGLATVEGADDDQIRFSIRFPAGVTITYLGSWTGETSDLMDSVEGTWIQHAEGIFGTDSGTWSVARGQAH